MNAYELADKVVLLKTDGEPDWAYRAYDMLRQQADRIAELEKDLALKTRDRDVFRDFTLAYEKRIEELEKLEQDFIRVIKQTNPNKPQTKPLSDEEILQQAEWMFGTHFFEMIDDPYWIEFAKAILKKASEK